MKKTALKIIYISVAIFGLLALSGCPSSGGGGSAPPALSQAPIAEIASATSARISWQEQNGADKYTVYWAVTEDFTLADATSAHHTADSTASPATIELAPTPTETDTFYFKVTVWKGSSQSPPSLPASLQFLKPDVPASFATTVLRDTPTTLKLTWSKAANASTYALYKTADPALVTAQAIAIEANKIGEADAAATFYNATELLTGTAYRFALVASNILGSSSAVSAAGTTLPSAPTGFAVHAVNFENKIDLSWSAVTGATGYNIYRSNAPDIQVSDSSVPINAVPIAVISWQDTGVSFGQSYWYAVVAINASGASPLSENKYVVAAPAAAVPQAVSQSRSIAIVVSWAAPAGSITGSTSYLLFRVAGAATTFTFDTATQLGTPVSALEYRDTGSDLALHANTLYRYKVVTINAGTEGNLSPPSAEASATTAPEAPAVATIVAGDGQVTLTWSSVDGATGYILYRSTHSITDLDDATVTKQTLDATATFATVTGLSNNTLYYFKLSATNANALESPASLEKSATPVPFIEGVPTNLTAQASGTTITLNWLAPVGTTPSGYKLYRSGSSPVSISGTELASVTATTYADISLADGVTWYYKVVATYADHADSTASNEVTATTRPAAVTNTTFVVSGKTVTLTWTESAKATSYKIYRSEGATAVDTGGAVFGTVTVAPFNTYSDNATQFGTTYNYKIVANNAAGDSIAAPATALTALTVPAAPTISATAAAAGVAISWALMQGATSYTLHRAASSGFTASASNALPTALDKDSTSVVDTPPSSGATWYYKLVANNISGSSDASNEASALWLSSAPAAPLGLTTTPQTGANAGSIVLNWTTEATASSYTLYWSTSSPVDTVSVTQAIPNISAPPYTHTSRTQGFKYYYALKAVNYVGTSAASSEASAQAQFNQTNPTPVPTGPAINKLGVSSITACEDSPFVLNGTIYRIEGRSWIWDAVPWANPSLIIGVSIVNRNTYVPKTDVVGSANVVTIGASIKATLPCVIVEPDPDNDDVSTAFMFVGHGASGETHKVSLFTSTDAHDWTDQGVVFEYPVSTGSRTAWNTNVTKAGTKYVMSVERITGDDGIEGWHGTFFEATALRGPWTKIPDAAVNGFSSPHTLRWDNSSGTGYYYIFFLPGSPHYASIARSSDLKTWTESRYNPILVPNETDDTRLFYPRANYSQTQLDYIADNIASNSNNSDVDLCEYTSGSTTKVLIEYENGNQASWGNMLEAEYVGTMESFLSGFFDNTPFPTIGWEGIMRRAPSDVLSIFATNRPGYGEVLTKAPDVSITLSSVYTESGIPISTITSTNTATALSPAFDGNITANTAFHTRGDHPAWATVDLQSVKTISGVYIYNRENNQGRAKGMTVSLSADGTDWTQVYVTSATAEAQYWVINLLGNNYQARYVKFSVNNATDNFLHLKHIEIWGGP